MLGIEIRTMYALERRGLVKRKEGRTWRGARLGTTINWLLTEKAKRRHRAEAVIDLVRRA